MTSFRAHYASSSLIIVGQVEHMRCGRRQHQCLIGLMFARMCSMHERRV